jgi:hypothetical protein
MKVVIAGEFILTDQSTGEVTHAKERDVLFFPKGTTVKFETPEYGLGSSPANAISQPRSTGGSVPCLGGRPGMEPDLPAPLMSFSSPTPNSFRTCIPCFQVRLSAPAYHAFAIMCPGGLSRTASSTHSLTALRTYRPGLCTGRSPQWHGRAQSHGPAPRNGTSSCFAPDSSTRTVPARTAPRPRRHDPSTWPPSLAERESDINSGLKLEAAVPDHGAEAWTHKLGVQGRGVSRWIFRLQQRCPGHHRPLSGLAMRRFVTPADLCS